MTPRGLALIEQQRAVFDGLVELAKIEPHDVDEILAMIIGHLRAWRPVSVAPLGSLGPPTERIRDPRGEP